MKDGVLLSLAFLKGLLGMIFTFSKANAKLPLAILAGVSLR